MSFRLKKYENNPILTPRDNVKWEERCVLNPAVIYDDSTNEFVMIYRCAGNDARHKIKLGLAKSKDGINFYYAHNKPLFNTDINDADGGCVEDPRLVKIDDVYYLTYAARAYAPGRYWLLPNTSIIPKYITKKDVIADELPHFAKTNITVSYLAATKDFIHYKKLGRITDSRYDDRDVLVFPERVNGKYVRISRPKFNDGRVNQPSIWISYGDDVLEYEEPELLITGEQWWEKARMGAACPPIKTDKGWLMFYHGVDQEKEFYRVGALLLDLNNPKKILARTKDYIMEPEEDYENSGLYNGCVFPTGNVLKDGIIYIYYGCADRVIALATTKLDDILKYLINECKK